MELSQTDPRKMRGLLLIKPDICVQASCQLTFCLKTFCLVTLVHGCAGTACCRIVIKGPLLYDLINNMCKIDRNIWNDCSGVIRTC